MNVAFLCVIAMGSAGVNTAFFWLLVIAIALIAIRRQGKALNAEAEDRPADQGAGVFVNELVKSKGSFRAAGSGGAGEPVIEIDGGRAIVTFYNCTFVRQFVGNPEQARMELPFSAILSAYVGEGRYREFLTVRTTQGRVSVSDNVKPFEDLADLLADIAELNRTSPAAYAAALAQEPKIKTAWYGWVILASAVGAVIYCCQKYIH